MPDQLTITTAARRVARWLNQHGRAGLIYSVRDTGTRIRHVANFAATLTPDQYEAGVRLVRCSQGPNTYADVQRQLDDPHQVARDA